MELFIVLGLIGALITGFIASSKGRSIIGWALFGLISPLLAIIICSVLPNLKQQAQEKEYDERERRRLTEQLRQERMKNEAFRQHAAARLDRHDNLLGTDTRESLRLESSGGFAQLPGQGPTDQALWHYLLGTQSMGPIEENGLRGLLINGEVTGQTLVWRQGMSDWIPAAQVTELQDLV